MQTYIHTKELANTRHLQANMLDKVQRRCRWLASAGVLVLEPLHNLEKVLGLLGTIKVG